MGSPSLSFRDYYLNQRKNRMIKLIIINLLLVYFVFTSCDSKNNRIEIIEIDIENFHEVSFFDIFSNVEIIPLETNEQSLIKDITKVAFYENKYFILDYGKGEILIFDTQGNFLNKISDKGQGPNQYLIVNDFDIDYSRDVLTFLSPVNNSMYEYDLKGNFRTKYKLPNIKSAYNRFKYLNKDTLVFWTFDYNNRIKFFSKNKNIIFREIYPEKDNILNNFTLSIFPYKNFFCRSACNTVYEITSNAEIIEKYKWDFMNLNNKRREIKKFEEIPSYELPDYINKIVNSDLINYIFSLHGGNSQYYYAQILRKTERINIFHDKTNDKNYIFEKTIENAAFHPLSWYEDYVIGFYSDVLGTIEETLPDAILDNKSIRIKEQLNEYDNPVLIKYHFKK